MQLFPMRNGVTLGSWRYSTKVDHKCSLMAFVHGAFLALPLGFAGPCDATTSSGTARNFSFGSSAKVSQWSSSDMSEKRLNKDALVCVDLDVEGLLDS